MSILSDILKDTEYGLDLFTEDEIKEIENRVFKKTIGGQKKYYVECIIRDKEILLKPEEIVRQLYSSRSI